MEDLNQIEVPPSFTAIFASPAGQRLLQPMSVVRRRYELCEDLAQMLTEQASTVRVESGHGEREVLRQMRLALTGPESAVAPAEAVWVVTRLAELLGWDAPAAR